MTQRLTLRRPDDMHLHLRDGAMLTAVAPESARDFARAFIMPNLVPPVVTGAQAAAYRDRILPISRTKPDTIVAGGGHVISMTHAAKVTAFLLSCLSRTYIER